MTPPEPSAASFDSMLESVHAPTVACALLVVGDAIRMGQVDLALGLLDAAARRFGDEPAVELTRAALLARGGRLDEAAEHVACAKERDSAFLVPRLYRAQLLAQSGQREAAQSVFRELVSRCPDYPGLAGNLASVLLPGPSYREVLATLHRILAPRGYLEIGVETGATLALANCPTIIGIDPDLRPLKRATLRPHAQLFEMTSAAFFSTKKKADVARSHPLDLVFIDGLHRYETSVADFAAVETWAHGGTVVVMHDALPIAPAYATPERATRFWVGDVWKTLLVLLETRKDLRVRIIPTPPSGLVVITQLRPEARLPADYYDAAIAGAAQARLSDELPPWPKSFQLVTNDEAGYRDALGPLARVR